MNATNIQTQWGKVLLVLAAVGAVMGAMIMVAAPASAHHGGGTSTYTTSPTVCVPTAGQPYIAPTVIHHDAVTHVEWKYSEHGGSGQLWVDNHTFKYIKNGVGTNTKPEHGTYYERTEHTRTVTDVAAYDEVTNPGQPYIAPVVCETTSTTTSTSTTSTSTTTTSTSTTTTAPPECPVHWGWSDVQQTCVIVECDPGYTPNVAQDGCDPVTTTTTTTTTSTTTTSPPVDVCPNIPGDQATVPDGYLVNSDGFCVFDGTSSTTTTTTTTTTSPPVDVCPNIQGDQATVPEGYIFADGQCLQDVTLGVSSSDTPTATLTEVTLAATGAGGTTGGVALALSLVLGGLGVMLLRRQVNTEI